MRVSVIITCHNYEDLVGDAIRSVFDQTHRHCQLFVVDDGSTDGSWEVIMDLCKPDAKFPCTIIRYERKMGPAWAKNLGMQETWDSSDLFAFLDADDVYAPGKITQSVRVFKEEKLNVGLVYSDEQIVAPTVSSFYNPRPPYEIELLNQRDYVGGNYIVSRKAIETVGNFDTYFEVCENYELARRISQRFALVHVPGPLVRTTVTDRALRRTVPDADWQFFKDQAKARVYAKTH